MRWHVLKNAEKSADQESLLWRSITPALAQPVVWVCETARALTLPLAASACETKWNWSEVPQMSLPPPWIVQVPPLRDWLPARAGFPISPQFQPRAQLDASELHSRTHIV